MNVASGGAVGEPRDGVETETIALIPTRCVCQSVLKRISKFDANLGSDP